MLLQRLYCKLKTYCFPHPKGSRTNKSTPNSIKKGKEQYQGNN